MQWSGYIGAESNLELSALPIEFPLDLSLIDGRYSEPLRDKNHDRMAHFMAQFD
ncbi:hypothetical protein RSAG8_10876, partial [Rhizoctonia solani AG-8 WAC10335]